MWSNSYVKSLPSHEPNIPVRPLHLKQRIAPLAPAARADSQQSRGVFAESPCRQVQVDSEDGRHIQETKLSGSE